MYSSFQLARKYFQYYFSASNSKGHGMHSPFVFEFIVQVLNNKSNYEPPVEIENLRKELLADQRILEVKDLGAGSRAAPLKRRTVANIAASALKPKKLAFALYRLARHYQPGTILELGTSLGITTAYFARAMPEASIITIEGSSSVAAVARENFRRLAIGNIQIVEGHFDEQLPMVLRSLSTSPDLVYIDGNHRYQPTINYFHQMLAVSGSETILVFDDIHWSAEMEKAWEEIRQHPSVPYTIDTFFLGFVFFKKEFKTKQNFTIRLK